MPVICIINLNIVHVLSSEIRNFLIFRILMNINKLNFYIIIITFNFTFLYRYINDKLIKKYKRKI
jgi:hypothetical protein